jgi:hypothetical protein
MSSRLAKGLLIGAFSLFAQVLDGQRLFTQTNVRSHAGDELNAHSLFEPQSIPDTETASTNRKNYLGDEACGACHSGKTESYVHTAHHLSSRLPTQDSIFGSFAEGKNILKTSNPALYFRMEAKADGFYQTSVWASPTVTASRKERFDIVIGTGRVGQSYLYWKDDRLFQLPVSYWTDLESWVNSPGYRDGTANFDRPVVARCLECHVGYAESVAGPDPPNHFKPASLVMGISCERCHGPGRDHAEAMATKKATAGIVNPAKLTRERQIEVCAQCHGGKRMPVTLAFSYIPGEPLDNYFRRDASDSGAAVDVHGNHVALLEKSRCFQSSPEMNCSTCHDVHQTRRGVAEFSSRCLKCHKMETCGEFQKLREKIAENCVDCHMPVQASNKIISNSNGKQARAMVRNHWIKIYPETRTP